MTLLLSETLLSLPNAARRLPGRPSVSTLHRWRLRGVRNIKLKTVKIGGRRFTSMEWLSTFSEAVTAASDGESPPSRSRTERERAIEQAERELDGDGI